MAPLETMTSRAAILGRNLALSCDFNAYRAAVAQDDLDRRARASAR